MKGGFIIKKYYLGVVFLSSLFAFNDIQSINAQTLYVPGGENIAIEIKSDGLLVTGTYDVKTDNGIYNPEKDSDIKRGDLIYKVNNQSVDSIEDLPHVFKDITSIESSVPIKLYRDNISLNKNLKLVKSSKDSNWKTGLLVKEKILGIGTVTFYNPNNSSYVALGHQFSDNDFSKIMDLTSGSIYESEVIGIKKSSDGIPGEKIAKISDNKIGTIIINNEYGIYGKVNKIPSKNKMEIASQQEVKKGEAQIYTVVEGNKIQSYDIKITDLKKQDKISTKGIVFEITDKKLLNISNGIVQGMSGSPIIQDNKIIGAVTHVLVDDVSKGYGLYASWMLEQMTKLD